MMQYPGHSRRLKSKKKHIKYSMCILKIMNAFWNKGTCQLNALTIRGLEHPTVAYFEVHVVP
jgi:hypothetical protein